MPKKNSVGIEVAVRSAIFTAALMTSSTVLAQGTHPNAARQYDWPQLLHETEVAILQYGRPEAIPNLPQAELMAALPKVAGKLQFLATYRSMVGDTIGAIAAFDAFNSAIRRISKRPTEDVRADKERITKARAFDAIPEIVKAASKTQILILNESHHVPQHRAFAMALARELRKIGYEYLAGETFSPTSLTDGKISEGSGYYSNEPVFSNFLHEALQDGWKFIEYESRSNRDDLSSAEQLHFREQEQAENISARILRENPRAKIFVYVGYSHVLERPNASNKKREWMAAQLKKLSGIDPLTIDQTSLYAHTIKSEEHGIYREALKKNSSKRAFILHAPDGSNEQFGDYKDAVDIQVIHPETSIESDTLRPDWLRSTANFLPVSIPTALIPKSGSNTVFAYRVGEGPLAVAADVVQLEAGKPAPKFMLPRGQFIYVSTQ